MTSSNVATAKPRGQHGAEGKGTEFLPREFTPFEFDAFCLAGKEFNMEHARVLDDFKDYLSQRNVPSYVVHSLRPHPAAGKKPEKG